MAAMPLLNDEVEGFDPANDAARSASRGTVTGAYEDLLRRGRDEQAEELRRATGRDQIDLAKAVVDYDPEYDEAQSVSTLAVQRFYNGLRTIEAEAEDGDFAATAGEEADRLRTCGTVHQQHELIHDLRAGLDVADLEGRFDIHLR